MPREELSHRCVGDAKTLNPIKILLISTSCQARGPSRFPLGQTRWPPTQTSMLMTNGNQLSFLDFPDHSEATTVSSGLLHTK